LTDVPTVWTSPDLVDWTRDLLPGGRPGTFASAAAEGDGTRLVAASGGPVFTGDPILWRSVRGQPWLAVRADGATFADGSVIRGITYRTGRFVAVGGVLNGTREVLDAATAAIWVSTDGSAWQRASAPQLGEHAWLTDVQAGPTGFVAGGQIGTGTNADGTLLFSPEGALWEPVQAEGLAGPAIDTVRRVVASPSKWVVTVATTKAACAEIDCAQGPGAILTSPDGRSWTVLAAGDPPPAPLGSIGEEFVAVESSNEGYRLISSEDGFRWSVRSARWQPDGDAAPNVFGLAGRGILAAGSALRRLNAWSASWPP
jgi:hypothetical protein